jgi:hypothetical protein
VQASVGSGAFVIFVASSGFFGKSPWIAAGAMVPTLLLPTFVEVPLGFVVNVTDDVGAGLVTGGAVEAGAGVVVVGAAEDESGLGAGPTVV